MALALLKNENPIVKAASTAELSPVKADKLFRLIESHPIDRLNSEIASILKEGKKGLSKKEKSRIQGAENAIKKFNSDILAIQQIKARHEYPILPYAPLKWRRPDGLPVLVPFNLDDPVFSGEFGVDEYGRLFIYELNVDIPRPVNNCYERRVKPKKKIFGDGNYAFSTYFGGLIPVSLIPLIKEAKGLFSDIFIIAEAGEYKIKKRPKPKPKPVNIDPLVVGYYDGQMYLIAAFDLSPMEEAFVETTGEGGFTKLERSQDSIMLHQLAGYLEL